MPSHLSLVAGKITPLPRGPLNAHDSMRLIAKLRRNELSQARAARQAVQYYSAVRVQVARRRVR